MTATDTTSDINRRTMLRNVFLGLGAASLPTWVLEGRSRSAQTGGAELGDPARAAGGAGLRSAGRAGRRRRPDRREPPAVRAGRLRRARRHARGRQPGHPERHRHARPRQPRRRRGLSRRPTAAGSTSRTARPPRAVSARIRFDAAGDVVDYYRICTGTRNNCAGGQTPVGHLDHLRGGDRRLGVRV